MKQGKMFMVFLILVLAMELSVTGIRAEEVSSTVIAETETTTAETAQKPSVKKQSLKKIRVRVKKSDLLSFFKRSAFIGSSIGVGQRMYLDYEGRKYLGSPKMLVKGCYSFSNDNIVGGQYRLTYQGKDYSARDAVAKAKVKYVFINMGTNDLYESPEKVYERYKKYIKGIQKKNPGIRIFIESTTPVFHAGQKGGLNNKNVNRLNKLMEKYCNRNRDLYFIDITTALKDSHGGLAAEYCSDHYVHITMSGYRVWTQKVCAYVKHLLIQEKKAKIAVKYAKKRKIKKEYMRAKRLVGQLEKSTLKTELTKKLKGIKYD